MGLVFLGTGRWWADLIAVFSCLTGVYREDGARLLRES